MNRKELRRSNGGLGVGNGPKLLLYAYFSPYGDYKRHVIELATDVLFSIQMMFD